ncbi:MAG: nucleotide exchange factor GrpE [Thermotogae bacterium]|nr:nucleotide exchange factor GrpE [Thermotogota bacterium]
MEELKKKEEKNSNESEEKRALQNKKTQAEEEEKEEDEIDQLKREKEELVQRVKELEEYAKHLKARFDNYVLQAQKDRERILKTSNEYLITRILPVLENFERALVHAENAKLDTMLKGVQMIYNQLKRILEGEGLSEIFPRVGDEFDPYYHEAVESVETQDYKEHSIVEILEKGYKLNAKVLKPAKVKVAVAPKHPPVNTEEGED